MPPRGGDGSSSSASPSRSPTLLVLVGVTPAWPLFALPLALALSLGGPARLRRRRSDAGARRSRLRPGRPGADGAARWRSASRAFVATGLAVGAGHHAQRRDAARIASLSLTDRLTGVHNYAFFEDALPRECRRAARYGLPLSLVLLDLDHFKAFNDRFGHDAGNRLLSAVGDAIRDSSRASDIAARFGGEEFALIIPGPAEEALEAAERIRAAVRRSARAGGRRRGGRHDDLGGRRGLPHGPTTTATRMLERADKALYHSKAAGRDRVSLFSPEQRWAAAS